MRRDYINDNEPELTAKEWMRYGIFAVVADFLAAVLLGVRMAQAMLGPEIDWLREAVPPIADLFFLGLLIILSMKTLTIWRKTETHPRRRQMRILMVSLLGQAWLYFIIGSYVEPFTRWALLTSS